MKAILKQHQVRTGDSAKEEGKEKDTLRMPHERDESDDSQQSGGNYEIEQAYKDLQSGQVDTDLRNTSGVDEVVNDRPGKSPDKVVKKSF